MNCEKKTGIRIFLIVIFIGLIFGALASWLVAGSLVEPAQKEVGLPNTSIPIKSFKIESKSGENLSGWHLKRQGFNGVVVLFHGVRASKASMFTRAKLLYGAGFSVVLIDFQSHGGSSGNRITFGYLEKYDVLATIEYARVQHLNEPIGVIGVSLGGVSTVLAMPQNIDALVIESIYPDIQRAVHNRVKTRLGVFSWLPSKILLAQLEPRLGFSATELSPIEKIDAIAPPIFVISGGADIYTTEEETKQIYSKANQPKQLWLAKGIGHKDIYNESPLAYEKKVIGFLKKYMAKEL